MNPNHRQLKAKLIRVMSEFVERIHEYNPLQFSVQLTKKKRLPSAFKAGTSDKMIFGKIIDESWPDIEESYYKKGFNSKFIGVSLVIQFYYHDYGDSGEN